VIQNRVVTGRVILNPTGKLERSEAAQPCTPGLLPTPGLSKLGFFRFDRIFFGVVVFFVGRSEAYIVLVPQTMRQKTEKKNQINGSDKILAILNLYSHSLFCKGYENFSFRKFFSAQGNLDRIIFLCLMLCVASNSKTYLNFYHAHHIKV
jgi:hypothetical protein